jgi:pimeloyl-ACP methyl ester carboxylesterase
MNKITYTRILYSLIFFIGVLYLFLITGCSDEDPAPPPEQEYLVSYDEVLNYTKAQIDILIALAGLEELSDYMEYDITVYTITYKTDYLGQEVTASGLVAFPITNNALPLLSFQHGTITRHSDAPTQDLNLYGLLSSVASSGYIFCIPDLIGFGSSTSILHPYYHAETTAKSVIDILKAAEELSEVLNYNFNGDVFLAGYSEGGFATMSTHKRMEETNPEGFNLIASAPASGGYDIKGMQEYFFGLETYHQPYYLAYVALSYQQTYGFDDILTDIFQEPYASEIPGHFDGSLSGGEINSELTDVMADLVQADILANINTDSKYDYLNNVFEENSVDNWVPETRMIMYHGTADITVPYQNSVDTYNTMIQLGTSENILSFVPLQDATHDSGIFPYVAHVIETFDSLK